MIIACETLIIALSFAGVASYQVLSLLHSDEYFLMEDGISRIFVESAVPFIVSGTILIVMVLVAYFGKKVPSYIMFQRLGISNKDMKSMLFVELAASYVLSLVFGLLLGNFLIWIIKKQIINRKRLIT